MNLIKILELQIIFGKTPEGRFIGSSLMALLKNCLRDPNIMSLKMISCSNCGFVAEEELFTDGCKNCGSKDFELIN